MYAPNLRLLLEPEGSPLHDVLVWFNSDEHGLSRRPVVTASVCGGGNV